MKISLGRKKVACSQKFLYDNEKEAVAIESGLEVVPSEWNRQSANLQVEPAIEIEQTELYKPQKKTARFKILALVWGSPSKRLWTILGHVVTLAVALILGSTLGVGFRPRKSSPPDRPQDSTPSSMLPKNNTIEAPSSFSTSGAFYGTGIALLNLGIDSVNQYAYYQHHTGQIRSSALINNQWGGGKDRDIVVASGARNQTPLAAVSYRINGTMTWHIFYIDSSNVLQEMTNSDTSNKWVSGPIGKLNRKPLDSPTVGLTAEWNRLFYGVKDGSPGLGIRLFYGVNKTAVQELSWAYGDEQWGVGQTLSGTRGDSALTIARAGYKADKGLTYLYLQNTDNELELWWKEFDAAAPRTPSHPYDVWNKGVSNNWIYTVQFHYDGEYIYFQDHKNALIAIGVVPKAEFSSWGTSFKVDTATSQTQLACISYKPTEQQPIELHIFYQTNGSDITKYIRSRDGGQSSFNAVPVG